MNHVDGQPAWERYDAFLFDIDGTLLHCEDAVHYFAFCQVLSSVAGRPIDLTGVTAHGNTDVGILRDAFHLNGIEEAIWRPQIVNLKKELVAQVKSHRHQLRIKVLSGVEFLLRRLADQGSLIAVATGNLAGIATIKLETVGLLSSFSFLSCSDHCEDRSDVFRSAVERVQILLHHSAQICAIGDTPADVQAARSCGIDCVAVATGIYSWDELQFHNPTYLLSSLVEP